MGRGIKFWFHSPGSWLTPGRKKVMSGKGLEPPGFPEGPAGEEKLVWDHLGAWRHGSITVSTVPQARGLVICHTSAQGAAALTLMKSPYL